MKITDSISLVRDVTARNRVVMPPMCTCSCSNKDGVANNFHIQHYAARAYGGIGTIVVEATAISPEGRITDYDLGLYNDNQIEPLRQVVAICKGAKASIGIQLSHAGSNSKREDKINRGATTQFDKTISRTCQLFKRAELQEVEDNFVAAAHRAKLANFDFVELHAAHGYLLSELISAEQNEIILSDDILERAQLVIRIAKRIHDEVRIPVGVRVSAYEYTPRGITPEKLKPLIRALEPYLSYVHVSAGNGLETIPNEGPRFGKLRFLDAAIRIKKYTHLPVISVCHYTQLADLEIAFAAGIDAVAVGRGTLFDPYFVLHVLKAHEIRNDVYPWTRAPWFDYASFAHRLEKTQT